MNPPIDSIYGYSPKHRSGIDVIDDTWGGLYKGGSYLVYGRTMSGRALLALMLSKTGVSEQEKTLFISSDRQKDLFIQAASVGLDLRSANEAGSIRVMRIPSLKDVRHDNDESVAQALTDLVDIIVRFQPTRVILNDFMPFIAFRSFRRFQIEFVRFLERVDSLDSTIVLVMPEPGNAQSRRVIEFMGMQMTGSIHIELAEHNLRSTKRRITLIPHIGHIRHRVVDYWDLEDVVDDSVSAPPAPREAPPPRDHKPAEDPAPTTHLPDPVELSVSKTPELVDYTDAEAFQKRLQEKFDTRDSGAPPFLLLAMRMDRRSENKVRPFDFDFLMDLVQTTLREGDDMFVNLEDERLIVYLDDSVEKDARVFFGRLKSNLQRESPQRADHLLHSVAAIIAPNGTPFESAAEFFDYAITNEH